MSLVFTRSIYSLITYYQNQTGKTEKASAQTLIAHSNKNVITLYYSNYQEMIMRSTAWAVSTAVYLCERP